YWRRTGDRDTLEAIWPNVKAGLDWVARYGDRDGDGFVEYARMRESGLRNQGWKDSALRRPRRRRLRRVCPDARERAAQPGLEGLRGRHLPRRRPPRGGLDRAVRGAG